MELPLLVLITGVAGFIGSRVAARMLNDGHNVIGLDAWRPYYDIDQKRRNLAGLRHHARFRLEDTDLAVDELSSLLGEVEVVFHHAAQPGVRRSWNEFATYVQDNVVATQRLLAACTHAPSLRRFIYASSSSVYGNPAALPTSEDVIPAPHNPYGVTKLAAEHLVTLYARNFGVPTASLRYFTVYGPGQRPDMAIHRVIRAALLDEVFPLYGDGRQVRDFTYVDDVVTANALAAVSDLDPGVVMNVAGGSATNLADLIEMVTVTTGRGVRLEQHRELAGDVSETRASTVMINRLTGWVPTTTLEQGIANQVAWQRRLYDV